MLPVSEAQALIMSRAKRLGVESVPLDDCLGRVLAIEAIANRLLPPRDNSAMDGYAICAEDVPGTLPIAAEIAAGATDLPEHQPRTATRIMTGAPMPAGADTVVMREQVTVEGEAATFTRAPTRGANVRRAGEDIELGASAVPSGRRIGAGEIGLLAALGFPRLDVVRAPRVGILSTGSELVDLTDNPPADRIINSNAHALAAAVREAGGVPTRHPIVGDTKQAVIDAIGAALESTDVLLTSGGVSVGDYDFVKEALTANGVETLFWKVAVKPGKPLVFGIAPQGALVFGLPGNPVSSMVTFELFVRPALLALAGATRTSRPRARVRIDRAYKKDAGRTHFLRATLHRDGPRLDARLLTKQGSGMITSMTGVDAFVVIDADETTVEAGDEVDAIIVREP